MDKKTNANKKVQNKTSSRNKKVTTGQRKTTAIDVQNTQSAQQGGKGLGALLVELVVMLGAIVGFAALLKYGLEYAF